EAGEYLHHAGVEPALVTAELVPGRNPLRARRQLGAPRDHAELLLAREDAHPERFPPLVVAAAEARDPALGRLVRRVHRAGREVQEERLAWRRLLLIEHEADGAIGEVVGQMVARLGRRGRLDEAVVAHQLGRPLVRVAVQEAVVALETEAERPADERSRSALLPARREV